MSVIHKTNVQESITNKPNAITAFGVNADTIYADGTRSVANAYTDGQQLPYQADDGAGLWESGIGTYTLATNIVTRTIVLESSNADNAVDFSAGAAITLMVAWPANIAQFSSNAGVCIVENDGATVQSITQNVTTQLTTCFTTIVSDDNNWWNATNKQFKPTRAGWYLVGGGFTVSIDADVLFAAYLYKNGVEARMIIKTFGRNSASAFQVSGQLPVYMNGTTDVVDIRLKHGSAAAGNTEASGKRTFFVAQWIGE